MASDSIDHKIKEANTFVDTKRQDLEKVMTIEIDSIDKNKIKQKITERSGHGCKSA